MIEVKVSQQERLDVRVSWPIGCHPKGGQLRQKDVKRM
jgi:hypothetical protein